MAACVGSIAPACAATFGLGVRPPTIFSFGGLAAPISSTRRPRYLRTSVPLRRYVVVPSLKSARVKWPVCTGSAVTQPVTLIGFDPVLPDDDGGVAVWAAAADTAPASAIAQRT